MNNTLSYPFVIVKSNKDDDGDHVWCIIRRYFEVDTAFLHEIERWRELLARNIALRNTDLSQSELNFAVQQTIDRIVFLWICEDRGIEDYGCLMSLINGSQVYQRLFRNTRKISSPFILNV
jgi:hypothetical protein